MAGKRYLKHKKTGLVTNHSPQLVATGNYIEIGQMEFDKIGGYGKSDKGQPKKDPFEERTAIPADIVVTDDEISPSEVDKLLGNAGADAQ